MSNKTSFQERVALLGARPQATSYVSDRFPDNSTINIACRLTLKHYRFLSNPYTLTIEYRYSLVKGNRQLSYPLYTSLASPSFGRRFRKNFLKNTRRRRIDRKPIKAFLHSGGISFFERVNPPTYLDSDEQKIVENLKARAERNNKLWWVKRPPLPEE